MGLFGDIASTITGPIEDNANRQNQQDVANLQAQTSQSINAQNLAYQQEFAQNGIQWRVADAAKVGISPLAALGAAEPSYSPAATVFPQEPTITKSQGPLDALKSAGNAVDDALMNAKSDNDRKLEAIQLRTAGSQADLVQTQADSAKLSLWRQLHPPNPAIPSQLNAWTTMKNADGTTSTVPSAQAAQASHGEPFGPLIWQLHNGLIPTVQDLKTNLIDHNAYDPSSDSTSHWEEK